MLNLIVKNKQGFTIAEIMVAIGVFSVVVAIAIGGLTRALRMERQITALVGVNGEMSLVIEQMAREIRTGFDFVCWNALTGTYDRCPSGTVTSTLAFSNANYQEVAYCEKDGFIERSEGTYECGTGYSSKLTSDHVIVRYLRFELFGTEAEDCHPPRVTVSLGVAPAEKSLPDKTIDIQTTVSGRLFSEWIPTPCP